RRERGRKVGHRATAVTALRAEGLPGRIATLARGRCANADDGPPEVVGVLGLPRRDPRVGEGEVHQREQARVFHLRIVLLHGDGPGDLVVEAWRRAQTRAAVIGPEDADLGVIGGADGAVLVPQRLDFVKSRPVLVTVEEGESLRESRADTRVRTELRAAGQGEGRDTAPGVGVVSL